MDKKNTIYTILGIGVTVGIGYVIYKSWKAYKSISTEEISGEDVLLKRELERVKKISQEPIEVVEDEDENEEIILTEEDIEEWEEENIEYDDGDVEPHNFLISNNIVEEKLRHDPNSVDAWNQFVSMMCSDYEGSANTILALRRLFEENFSPVNVADANIVRQIIINREHFFGKDSIYSKNATFAELLIYFAGMMNWHYEIAPEDAMQQLLINVEVVGVGDSALSRNLKDLKDHNWVNSYEKYGLFALDTEDYDLSLLRYPGVKVRTNDDITFLMEFNVWGDLYSDTFYERFDDGE